MYNETRDKFNWHSFLLKALFLIIILILIVKLLPKKESNEPSGQTEAFKENMNLLKNTANEYITEDKIPNEVNKSKTYSLEDLVSDGTIRILKTEDGEICDHTKSYLKITKQEKGHKIEIHLVCGDEEETVSISKKEASETTTKETTTKETTTKKVTTTKKPSTTKAPTTTYKTTTKLPSTTTSIKTQIKPTTTSSKVMVTFVYNDDTGKVVREHILRGNKVVKPSDPTKEGYVFEGWMYNGSPYNFNTVINDNIFIYAKWK